MSNNKNEDKPVNDDNQDAAVKPDPETLNTTDPEEHMQGPVSTLMQKIAGSFDSKKTQEEADEEKEKNM